MTSRVVVAGDHDEHRDPGDPADHPQHVEPVEIGQSEVARDDVRRALGDLAQRLETLVSGLHRVAVRTVRTSISAARITGSSSTTSTEAMGRNVSRSVTMVPCPAYLRYLIIWLSCTAASVTAVIFTVHFVVGSTRPTAPVAQSAPEELAGLPMARPGGPGAPSPLRAPPGGSLSRRRHGRPASRGVPTAKTTPTPRPRTTSPRPPAGNPGCQEGSAGVHTVPSRGGKATVRSVAPGCV